jgi:hypothetical protein
VLFVLFDGQGVPPALEFIGEEHRTFHIMNIAEYEYSGQGGLCLRAAPAPGASATPLSHLLSRLSDAVTGVWRE